MYYKSALNTNLLFHLQVSKFDYPTDHIPDYLAILVPNVDNTRTDFLIECISKQGKAILLIGEQVLYLRS